MSVRFAILVHAESHQQMRTQTFLDQLRAYPGLRWLITVLLKLSWLNQYIEARRPCPLLLEQSGFSLWNTSCNLHFTIIAQNSRALIGEFLSSISGQTHECIIYAMRQRAWADNLTVCYCKKQMDVSFSCVCSVIDNEFRHNNVKVVCGSTPLSPRGSTSTLTMLWRNSWSITGQTLEKRT